jgi:hypothetical protein
MKRRRKKMASAGTEATDTKQARRYGSRARKAMPVKDMVLESYALDDVRPSLANVEVYDPIREDDHATITMVESIKNFRQLEPAVISADYKLLSGHRRHMALGLAGKKRIIVIRRLDVRRGHKNKPTSKFYKLLVEHNRQRVKNPREMLREAVIAANVDSNAAYDELIAHHKLKQKRRVKIPEMEIWEGRARRGIGPRREAFLKAAQNVLAELLDATDGLPPVAREIYYALVVSSDPPLTDAWDPKSRFSKDEKSYDKVLRLLTDARYAGEIDFEDIDDQTRPTFIPPTWKNTQEYFNDLFETLLLDYRRDVLQSQTDHIEIVYEKLSLKNVIEPIAAKYGIPATSSRGYDTTRPLYDIFQRYKASGKYGLIVIILSDLDPDGDVIANSTVQRLRDLHGVDHVRAFRCALTINQVKKYNLPAHWQRAKKPTKDKKGSSNYQRYWDNYHTDEIWELEALQALAPTLIPQLLAETIESVIDMKAFNAEIDRMRQDATLLKKVRQYMLETFQAAKDLSHVIHE